MATASLSEPAHEHPPPAPARTLTPGLLALLVLWVLVGWWVVYSARRQRSRRRPRIGDIVETEFGIRGRVVQVESEYVVVEAPFGAPMIVVDRSINGPSPDPTGASDELLGGDGPR